jgi:hypothetical protein
MRAKRLEAILCEEMAIGEAEMVQRFQKLRDMRLLPTSRGRNAEDIASDAVVFGLLSVVADRPGFAGMTANRLRSLVPVGGWERGFAQAKTFGAALEAALSDEALLGSVREIRITDDEVYTNSHGRGAIFYVSDGVERSTYYIGGETLTSSESYDPRALLSSMIHEVVIFPDVLKRIAYELRQHEKYSRLTKRFDEAQS